MLVFEGSTYRRTGPASLASAWSRRSPTSSSRSRACPTSSSGNRTGAEACSLEAELAFFAQDDDGNVWHLGEYPAEYRGGQHRRRSRLDPRHQGSDGRDRDAGAPAARVPSTTRRASPRRPSTGPTAQTGTNSPTSGPVFPPAGCYKGVLVIREFERSKPDASQLKYSPRTSATSASAGWAGKTRTERCSSWSKRCTSISRPWQRFVERRWRWRSMRTRSARTSTVARLRALRSTDVSNL